MFDYHAQDSDALRFAHIQAVSRTRDAPRAQLMYADWRCVMRAAVRVHNRMRCARMSEADGIGNPFE